MPPAAAAAVAAGAAALAAPTAATAGASRIQQGPNINVKPCTEMRAMRSEAAGEIRAMRTEASASAASMRTKAAAAASAAAAVAQHPAPAPSPVPAPVLPPALASTEPTASPNVLAAHTAAQANGEISGFKNGAKLTARELDLHKILASFSNTETAGELFGSGLNSINAVRQITPEKMSETMRNFNTNQHPICPNPEPVFARLGFDQAFETFAEWICYQPLIGVKPTASTWLSEPLAAEQTMAQLAQMATIEKDISLPKLSNIDNFRQWEQSFCQFLQFHYNENGFPLSYVIQLKEQQEVTAVKRSVTVRNDGMFPSWMEYNVRCALFDSPQFMTDNHDVWVLFCHAVREGPGWAYVRHHKDSDESTGDA
mmetsp:Transcript_21713/g.60316  ORF Transcript_21713/g.60316 Transcript_21713/m.60316 type:complete len:370 (-) Transcript_21713:139-1248(-)